MCLEMKGVEMLALIGGLYCVSSIKPKRISLNGKNLRMLEVT
jgi:hypothetical protein